MPAPSPTPASPPRAWAEISLGALRHNIRVARGTGGHPVMAVLKAGAYGHGLEEVARVLADEPGVAFFGVANVGEARRIAATGVETPIYLLGATWQGEREEIVARSWVPCLSSLDEAAHFDALARESGRPLRVHLAVDTGMGRGGFVASELPAALPHLEKFSHLILDGLGSHLPSADEDPEFTGRQIQLYNEVVLATGGPTRWKWRHLCNSAGLLGYQTPLCNLTRPGLMLYGHSPLPGLGTDLRPAMTLKARVSLVRELPAGHGVSYGRTYITTRPTKVATLGIGYGDGYPRHLSNQGARVFLHGQRVPVLGRVTMDQIMIDATELPETRAGDEAEIFGCHISVSELAAKAGTISWEILTRITARVTRVHVD
jgi:alanine racemase